MTVTPTNRQDALKFYRMVEDDARTDARWWEAERWLGQNDLFYLLVRMLRRPDLNKDWLFDRCQEVQAHPDGFLDLWAREHGKCEDADDLITLASGERRRLGDIVPGDRVMSIGPDGKQSVSPVIAVNRTGIKPVRRFTTARGRVISITDDHRVMGPNGVWQCGRDLAHGSWVAMPRMDGRSGGKADPIPDGWQDYLSRPARARHFRNAGLSFSTDSAFTTREKVARFAELDDNDTLTRYVASDVVWDQIESVSDYIEVPTVDIQVAGTQTYIANGIVSHNSSVITFGKTIQDILCDPEVTVGIFSHTRPVAKTFLRQIKYELESNDWLKYRYPDVLFEKPSKESPKWSEDDGIVVRRQGNPKEATVEAHGLVDGQPTGRHFQLRVYDDVVTRESVTTPDMVRKVTDAWDLSQSLGVQDAQGGRVRYIGTRYSLYDTYAEMMRRGAVIPRIYAATHNGQINGRPVLFDQPEWDKRVKNSSRAILAAQMLQNPMADEDATFRSEWLRSYDVRPRTMNVYIMADPSRGRSADSDNTAIAVIGIGAGGAKFLLDGARHRMTLSQRWTSLRTLYHKWRQMPGVMHIAVGYERYGAQSDDEYFQEQMELENRKGIENAYFDIAELNWPRDGTQSKRERVERLEPDFRNSRFYLPLPVWHDKKPCRWSVERDPESKDFGVVQYHDWGGMTRRQMDAIKNGSSDLVASAIRGVDQDGNVYDLTASFIDEYTSFPFGKFKDLVDAASRIYDMEPVPPVMQTAQDEDEMEFVD